MRQGRIPWPGKTILRRTQPTYRHLGPPTACQSLSILSDSIIDLCTVDVHRPIIDAVSGTFKEISWLNKYEIRKTRSTSSGNVGGVSVGQGFVSCERRSHIAAVDQRGYHGRHSFLFSSATNKASSQCTPSINVIKSQLVNHRITGSSLTGPKYHT